MKTVSIMQPYFFPYIGYWQLINSADTFVIYDDVQFIKSGWINRNRILTKSGVQFINLPVKGIGSSKLITDIDIDDDATRWRKLSTKIKMTYSGCSSFKEVEEIVDGIIDYRTPKAADYLDTLIRTIARELSINTEILRSSELNLDTGLKGEERVIGVCRLLEADRYINMIGGVDLYNPQHFLNYGIEIKFLKPAIYCYPQYNDVFVPSLSIIDVMMFNGIQNTKKMLEGFELVNK